MRIIGLFSLRPGTDREAFEEWSRGRDLPGLRALVSVKDFAVLRATGVLFGDDMPPYEYIEVLDITDVNEFLADVKGDAAGALAREMSAFTDKVTFLTTETVAGVAP